MLKRILLYTIILMPVLCSNSAVAQVNDSLLREQLTRGVQSWKSGKPVDAYVALDSVLANPTTQDVAATKVKAAIWTATFLQQQKKNAAALKFLDSAMVWSEQYARGEEYRRTYEAYADWHLANGNLKGAMAAKAQAGVIRDSLTNVKFKATNDSLIQLLQEKQNAETSATQVKQESSSESKSTDPITYGLAALSAILLLVVFRMNTTIQRLKSLPPAPQSAPVSAPVTKKPEPVRETVREEKPAPVMAEEVRAVNGNSAAAPVATPLVSAPVNPKDLTVRLSEVELVLIRPDILGRYGNGDWKSVRNLLNEYLSQLPLILKNLDDAITKSETAPILQGLEYLKPYLTPFGMNSTLALIREVEEDAAKVKASKLLSRVFQVRNHTRRAADEAKSILEKFS